ncbi:LADA_0F10836g1_1 [Lachancea dasiensis]|uniref:Golgi to ER traffic protein 2 n=1 Tax=Lachancea dasiensis TaxID=1072105 RepID=A0A1G4JLV7_9SACH|nr:LADA_0F10836g1_1 [Lachancea dasiensis]
MSETTESEKRRLLRERRQQKFGNGQASSRLAKITGQSDKSFLSTESPLDSRNSSPSPEWSGSAASTGSPTNNQDSTKQMDELLAQLAQKGPKKPTTAPTATPEPTRNPELDLFAQLAKMQQETSSTPGNGTPDTPDIFAQLMKSVQMDQQAQQSAEKAFAGVGGPPIDAAVLEAHNASVNKLKSYTILIKWVFFILPYIYYVTHTSREIFQLNSMNHLTQPANFFTVFTTFEIVTLSVYYQLLLSAEKSHKINTLNSNSKVMKLLSMVPPGLIPISNLTGKVSQALQYWDVISMYLTDLAFAILLIGIFQYYHAI